MKITIDFPYKSIKQEVKLEEPKVDDINYYFTAKVPEFIYHDIDFKTHSNNLVLFAEVNCSATMNRLTFQSKEKTIELVVPKKEVGHKFTVDFLLVVDKEIIWDGTIISKGMAVAHFGTTTYDIDSRSSGLITFCESDKEEIEIDFNGDQIKVNIPKIQFDFVETNRNDNLVSNLLASQLAQLALLDAFRELKPNSDYSHTNWFVELERRWLLFAGEEEGFPDHSDYLKFVNHILENPSVKMLNIIKDHLEQKKEEVNE